MGINTHYYTMYGVQIPYDNDLSDALYDRKKTPEDKYLYEIVEDSPHLDIVADGMGGEYIIIGKILFDSGDLRWNETNDTWVEIDLENLDEIQADATLEMMELLPDHSRHLINNKWKLITFMHLS